MCEATTILAAGSALMGAVGAVGGGVAANKQAKYQAAEMENQAKVADWQAEQTMEQTRQEQIAFDRQASRQRGEMAALQAASGLRMDAGSLLDIAADTAREQAIDRQNLGYQGQLNAWGYNNQANALSASAANAKAAGRNALASGIMSGAGSLLGGVGSAYGGLKSDATDVGNITGGKKSDSLLSSGRKSVFSFGKK